MLIEENGDLFLCLTLVTKSFCAGSVILTQTHPAAPYVCRTGNIILRCQYDGVENVLAVVWAIGNESAPTNPSTIPLHTALPRTTTYQELVVDSYTNLRERYQCATVLANGTILDSNMYIQAPLECKHKQHYQWVVFIVFRLYIYIYIYIYL